MKLSNLQKHYQNSFNKARRYSPPGSTIKYRIISNYNHKPYTNKKGLQYAKYMNVKVLDVVSDKNRIPGLQSKSPYMPYMIELLVNINNIPCTITYGNNNTLLLHMGYNINNKNYNQYSTVNNTNVLNCILTIANDVPTFRNSSINHMHQTFVNTKELQDIITAYNITDKELTEELQFQLYTISDTIQYYISMYQRMYHMVKQIKLNPNHSVLHLIRYAAGL